MENILYLDNAATTKTCDEAKQAMLKNMEHGFANPAALHSLGMVAEEEAELSKKIIAKSLKTESKNIVFTSGGTEGNNTAIFGAVNKNRSLGKHIIIGAAEHPSVIEPALKLLNEGYKVDFLPADKNGYKIDELNRMVKKDTILVSLMQVNNETGFATDLSNVKSIISQNGSRAIFHSDCVQAYMKMPIDINNYDIITVSSHKIHGPKGVGAICSNIPLPPFILGGGQQSGKRSGTEPVFLYSGFAAAVQSFNNKGICELNKYAREKLGEYVINSPNNASAYILNISIPGFKSETLLHFLEMQGIMVSSGSACSGGKKSRVLKALGFSDNIIDSALRISFNSSNTAQDVDRLYNALSLAQKTLIKKG